MTSTKAKPRENGVFQSCCYSDSAHPEGSPYQRPKGRARHPCRAGLFCHSFGNWTLVVGYWTLRFFSFPRSPLRLLSLAQVGCKPASIGLSLAVIPSLSRDLGFLPMAGRVDLAEMFRLQRCAPALNMTAAGHLYRQDSIDAAHGPRPPAVLSNIGDWTLVIGYWTLRFLP